MHISNLAAQTGASLFLQTRSPPEGRNLGVPPPLQEQHWVYNKTENLNPKSITAAKDITHVIAECHSGDMSGVSGTGFPVEHWKQVDVIRGFQRWAINPTILQNVDGLFHFWDVLVMVETDELAILERR